MANFGVFMFPTDYAIQPIQLATEVEARGLDMMFFPEHTHIPTNRRSPFPGGGDLPQEYWHSHDPFVALSAAAAVTNRIRLGTGICLVVERDPIQLAKEIASLDMISGGRFILGIGAGWNAEEMENHGANFKDRWKIVREKILAMKTIWTEEEAEFHGDYVDFDPIWSYPKPVQHGGPPIWMGANSKWCYDRIAEYCDGWMPIGSRANADIAAMRRACEARSRNPDEITLAMFGVPGKEDVIRQYLDDGYTELLFPLPPADADTVLPLLDKYAKLAENARTVAA
ncbi:MAG: LLM class F420-dependent oxidoreductase [Pseudomonadota bacterium]